MSKGLEELNKIKNYKEWTTVATIGGYERTKVKLAYNDELKESFIIIKKELKVLEIIKEKKVEVGELLESDTLVDYNETVFYTYPDKRADKEYNPYTYLLTQEEYDFLKEELL